MKTKFAALIVGLVCFFPKQVHAGAGALDPTFGAVVNGPIYGSAIQPDNRILIAGGFSSINGISRGHIARLYADGSLDLTFLTNNLAGASSTVWTMTQQSDGRIVIGGDFITVNSQSRYHVARLNFDGTLDASFNSGSSIGGTVYALAVQPDGKVLVGGQLTYGIYNSRYNLVRLNTDASLDTNFAPGLVLNGPVFAVAVQWDGKILVGGSFSSVGYGITRNNIVRLESDGTPDITFPNASSPYGVSGAVRTILIQPDDRILIGGDFTSINNSTMPRLGRMNSDGSTDTTFNYQFTAGPNATVYCLDLQNNSSILAGGAFTAYNSSTRSRVVRTFPDGTLDNSFLGTQASISGNVRSIAVQNDGKVLIGGEFTTINNSNRQFLARLYGDLYPPEIITQPQSKSTNVGATVTFNINVGNPTPVTYQWRKNGVDIPSATLNSYQLFNVQLADAGSYSAFLSDGTGGTNSTNAVLTVGIPPSIISQPSSLTVTQGQSATFSVGASGTPLSYQWFKSGVAILAATNSAYTIPSTLENNGGAYWVVVSNFLSKATSSIVTLAVFTPVTITLQPSSVTAGEGSNVVLQASVDGTSVTTQWYKNNSPFGTPLTLSGPTDRSLQLSAVQLSDSGDYFFTASNLFGQITSQTATVTVQRYPPVINTQPVSEHVPVGGSLSLSVGATGTTLNFQWQKDGFDISSATSSSLLNTNVALTDAGSYTVIVSNPLASITSAVAIVDVGYPASITNQPVAATTHIVGDTVTLSAGVDGTAPIQLLWLFNGSALTDATNATLTLTNVQLSDAGTYALTATNVYGGTVSSNATLFVIVAGPPVTPNISGQSASVQINGPPNGTCVVEMATNMTPPVTWQPIMTNCLSVNGTWNFIDTNALAQPETYYRITVQQ